jgi:FkbM family methyltransferase
MTARSVRHRARRRAAAALGALRSKDAAQLEPQPSNIDESASASEARAPSAVEIAAQRDVADFHNIRRLLAFSIDGESNCIDIGANRGANLSEMCRVAPRGRHIAFEPLPHLAALLRDLFPGVEIRQAALSDHAGTADFAYVHGASEGWSGLLFRPLPTGEEPEVEHIGVQLEVLDDVLDPSYRPAVIKIDVEGAEQQVILGALRTLRRHRPIVIFEHGLGSANAYGTHPADIYRLLCEDVGLRVFDLDGSGPYDLEEFERIYNAGERVNFVART